MLCLALVLCDFSSGQEEESTSGEAETLTGGSEAAFEDGVYHGSAAGMHSTIEVSVTVSDGKIADIEILSQAETPSLTDPAFEQVPAAIIESQSLDVETVSGATVTSEAIIAAVRAALEGGEMTENAPLAIEPDVIVVGAGMAGLATAVKSTELGLNVLLLEQSVRVGGGSHYSGGTISGARTADGGQAAQYRELLPMISLFGAGIGNQILAGKMVQGFALPVCRETAHLLPDIPGAEELRTTSWKAMTGTVSFTRMDDEKDVKLQQYLTDDSTPEKKDGEASTQMRYEVEYLVPGSKLYHEMTLQGVSEVELGAFVTAVCEFAQSPVLGGMSGKGFGLCDAEMDIDEEHISICNKKCTLTDRLTGAASAYNTHIKDHAEEIIALLGGASL